MLDDLKRLMTSRYGQGWLNLLHNQTGMAEDLSIHEWDSVRTNRKFGISAKSVVVTNTGEIVATYEVSRSVSTLVDVDCIFYTWWGSRASENISCIQREVADDEIIYHFITGTPTHGHSGRVVMAGRHVKNVIRRRLDQRIRDLGTTSTQDQDDATAADASANG